MSKKFKVEISARHVHLCEKDIEALFGAGHKLTEKRELSQPGQFACEERVDVVGPKGTIKNVIVLGPARPASQVEISLTDARALGIAAMIRESGVLGGTNGCKLVGPKGEAELSEGVIAAKRHVHMTPADAKELGVTDKQIVGVRVESPDRSIVFGDVVVRTNDNFALYMHIDTDEANAAGAAGELQGEIVKF